MEQTKQERTVIWLNMPPNLRNEIVAISERDDRKLTATMRVLLKEAIEHRKAGAKEVSVEA